MPSNNPAEWAGFTAPDGYELGWKAVNPDGRTHGGYQWPLYPKIVQATNIARTNESPCPIRDGDGLCIALGDHTRFFSSRASAVAAARSRGLEVDRSGAVRALEAVLS